MVERTGIKPVPVATLDDHAYVTPSLDILPPYNPCCIIRPPKDCNLDVLCSYTSILIGGRCVYTSLLIALQRLRILTSGLTAVRNS